MLQTYLFVLYDICTVMQLVRLAVRHSDLKNLNLEIGGVGNKAVDTDLQLFVPCSSCNALSLISKVYFPRHFFKTVHCTVHYIKNKKKDHQERRYTSKIRKADCQF
jgi:hypothetical protein